MSYYNLYSTSSPETIYASTSTGLYKTIFGCNDYAANNYANAENEECEYNTVISDGCDLQENYFYLSPVSNNLYELIYNSS